MQRLIDGWHSDRLGRHMEIVTYGHYGFPLLMFPTAAADYLEYERFLMIDAIARLQPGALAEGSAESETFSAELEGGVGCVATSSGMAAIASIMVGLLRPGDEILSSSGIFGGTFSLFRNVLGRFGVRDHPGSVQLYDPSSFLQHIQAGRRARARYRFPLLRACDQHPGHYTNCPDLRPGNGSCQDYRRGGFQHHYRFIDVAHIPERGKRKSGTTDEHQGSP